MDRDIKVFNRPVMNKIQQKNQELHRKRLQNIKVSHLVSKEWNRKPIRLSASKNFQKERFHDLRGKENLN